MANDIKASDIQATARVRVVVEVATSVWGGECPASQIFQQAAREGVVHVRSVVERPGTGMRIVGEPEVIAVIEHRKP